MLNRINKLSMPATILLGCIILGSFYFAVEVMKQSSLEQQRESAAFAEEQRISQEKWDRAMCASEAQESATNQYKETCTYNCKEGYYYTANYENYYKSCLQGRGLEP